MSSVEYYGKLATRLVKAKQHATSEPLLQCIRLVANDLRATHGSIWTLIYRQPKAVKPELQRALHSAVVELISGEIASLEHELHAVTNWSSFTYPGEIEEVQADLAALRERLAKMRGRS